MMTRRIVYQTTGDAHAYTDTNTNTNTHYDCICVCMHMWYNPYTIFISSTGDPSFGLV